MRHVTACMVLGFPAAIVAAVIALAVTKHELPVVPPAKPLLLADTPIVAPPLVELPAAPPPAVKAKGKKPAKKKLVVAQLPSRPKCHGLLPILFPHFWGCQL